MTNRVLAAAAVLAFTALPLAAHAQTSGVTAGATTGAVGGANVGGPIGAVVGGVGGARTSSGPGPASASMPLSSADLPTGIRKKSEVGAVLPSSGVQCYDAPAEYGVRDYRYTIVNDRTVLVDPRTHRIIEIIE